MDTSKITVEKAEDTKKMKVLPKDADQFKPRAEDLELKTKFLESMKPDKDKVSSEDLQVLLNRKSKKFQATVEKLQGNEIYVPNVLGYVALGSEKSDQRKKAVRSISDYATNNLYTKPGEIIDLIKMVKGVQLTDLNAENRGWGRDVEHDLCMVRDHELAKV